MSSVKAPQASIRPFRSPAPACEGLVNETAAGSAAVVASSPVKNRGQKPNFWYKWMWPGLWANVKSPAAVMFHESIRSIVAVINCWAMP
ncbi:hypothetical protein [Mycobacterium ostraviense]|uniref:Uncharacterized protein n=1 Tax=Mycobacterium ostraviense TaxID=2738409 RepID=A0A162E7A1_9MYCO|nr:hypothetical protein [Mycobacterium ostraviense]KZS66607.1 hypothetical protein A4G28_16195 [Mycobacterium ostraviense]UGT90981.1 hypothetical protein LTS72_22565 [Mycobacterium ostraviense]